MFTTFTKAVESKGSAMIDCGTKILYPDVVLLKFFTIWRENKKIQIELAKTCNKNEQQEATNNAEL